MDYSSLEIVGRVSDLLASRSVTASQMLSAVGLGQNTLINYRTSFPKADNLAKIADYFGVSVDFLLGRTTEAGTVAIPPENVLTEEEERMLSKFRNLSPDSRTLVMAKMIEEERLSGCSDH